MFKLILGQYTQRFVGHENLKNAEGFHVVKGRMQSLMQLKRFCINIVNYLDKQGQRNVRV